MFEIVPAPYRAKLFLLLTAFKDFVSFLTGIVPIDFLFLAIAPLPVSAEEGTLVNAWAVCLDDTLGTFYLVFFSLLVDLCG